MAEIHHRACLAIIMCVRSGGSQNYSNNNAPNNVDMIAMSLMVHERGAENDDDNAKGLTVSE